MSRGAGAIIVRPEGGVAGEDLAARLGMPSVKAYMAYDRETVMDRYRGIIAFLRGLSGGAVEDTESYFRPSLERIREREAEALSLVSDASIAVDSTVTIAPFSLALAMVASGLNVRRIYTSQLPEFEKPHLKELARLKGDIIVSNPIHAGKYGPRSARAGTDIAIGFEAGYATAAPFTVPLAFDERRYGFEGYAMILEGLIESVKAGKSDLRQQVKDYGLVV
jgi:hypothetical protein